MQLKRFIPAALLCSFGFFAGAPAFAQEDNVGKAVEMSKEAANLYRAGDYLMAAEKFRQAYELYPDPTLLKNQTVAYYKAEACPNALRSAEFYRQAVQGKTDIPPGDKTDVNQITAECEFRAAKAHVAADDLDKAERSIGDARRVDPDAEMVSKLDQLQGEIDARRVSDSSTREPDQTIGSSTEGGSSSTLAIIGWTATGLGVAALTGALVNQAIVAGDINDIKSECGDECNSDQRDQWQNKVDSYNSVSIPLYIGGGVLTAAGVGILIYHYTSDGDSGVSFTPTFGEDGAGAQLQMRF